MSVLVTVLLAISALFFTGMGLMGLTAPSALAAPFGIELRSADARNEIRAVYGGFGIAVGAVLGFASTDVVAHRDALIAVGIALLGMAAGRLLGRAVERPTALYPVWLYFWVELIIGSLLMSAPSLAVA